jgi:hypothetical protein
MKPPQWDSRDLFLDRHPRANQGAGVGLRNGLENKH